jgi:hypothetical protein
MNRLIKYVGSALCVAAALTLGCTAYESRLLISEPDTVSNRRGLLRFQDIT